MRLCRAVVPMLIVAVACERVPPPPPAPLAEFLVATADSVFWVSSDSTGLHVRGGPMMLTELEGRLVELYVADEDHSFYDAVFVGQRLYRRDLITGDSVALYGDTLMPRLASAYAAANPDERPLGDDEYGSETPRTIGSAELFVLDVTGPWASIEYRTDVDVVGGASSHGVRRAVLDLRTGRAVPLDSVLGARAARVAANEARAQWRMLRDSMQAAARATSPRPTFNEVLTLSFDPTSVALAVEGQTLQLRFTLVQGASPVASRVLELFPIAVEPPTWWADVRGGYAAAGERDERVWERRASSTYTLVARPVEGQLSRGALVLRDAAGTEWPLGMVQGPVRRVLWLDDTALPAESRAARQAALLRAFHEASFYSTGESQVAVATPRRP